MKKIGILIISIATILSLATNSFALSVEEIVKKTNLTAYYAGDDGKAHVKMTITDKQGRDRIREMIILRLDKEDAGEQKFYVYFKKPEDVREMVYMVSKHMDKDDDRWMYLPALDLVRRIAASDKRSSFVGSHFVYEDISGRSIEDDTHEIIDETKEFYILKNIPKDPNSVEFFYYLLWIDKITFMPMKAEYYDTNETLYKIIEALEVKIIQGYPTVLQSKATDLNSGGSTITTFSEVTYDVGLEDELFTERYLRKTPRKWIQ